MKAFFIECSMSFWLQAAELLVKQHNWSIVYWQGHYAQQPIVKKLFPQAVFSDSMESIKGVIPRAIRNWTPKILDQTILEAYASAELTCLKMMDRMDQYGNFSHQERVDFYYHQFAWALQLVERLAPEVAVFSTIPHVIFDYLLYEICKKKGVATLILERTGLPGLIFPMAQFEQGSLAVKETYGNILENFDDCQINISSTTNDHLARIRGDYVNGMPLHFQKKTKKYEMSGGGLNGVRALRWKLGFLKQPRGILEQSIKFYKMFFSPPPDNYVKQKGQPPWNSNISGLNWRITRKRENHLKSRYLRQYRRLASQIDLSKPYVFVALQRQPERSTCPAGGVYVDQHLMVKALSQSLPHGWNLYVKEHRSQFLPLGRMDSSRGWDYYPRLAAIDRVQLVPLEYSPFELIDKSRATATITGTVGWESVVRCKPSIVFGYPWYRYCAGVFHTPTFAALRATIETIQQGYQVDPVNVALFLETLQKIGLWAYFDKNYEEALQISPAQNAQRISRGLVDYLKKWGQG